MEAPDYDLPWLRLGVTVEVKRKDAAVEIGTVRYIGPAAFGPGEWIGIELHRPVGKNNGTVGGQKYFSTKPNHGLFVRRSTVTVVATDTGESKSTGSRTKPATSRIQSRPVERAEARKNSSNLSRINPEATVPEDIVRQIGSVSLLDFAPKRNPRESAITLPKNSRWLVGPVNQEGKLFDASDRNILCMSVMESSRQCVIGSADHGLKVFNFDSCKLVRELYNKRYGHTEWVTCVDFVKDGRIISGAMDSKVCLWDSKIVRCIDLCDHRASISCVKAGDNNVAISGSYDKTMILWDLNKAKKIKTLSGHRDPVLDFVWVNSLLLSGDREGVAKLWDLNSCICVKDLRGHGGQITSLDAVADANVVLTGAMDGVVKVWDSRIGNCIHSQCLHPSAAVNSICHSMSTQTIVSAGADKTIKVVDPRKSFNIIHNLKDHKDFIYSMRVIDSLAISGAGNGWLLVHDLKTGSCLYGLGANAAAVRCIECMEHSLIAAGDDGKVLVFDLS